MRDRQPELKPWMPFALPAAIAVPILAGFMLGGPPAGFFVAAVAAVTIVAVAVLLGEPPPSGDDAWVAAASRRMLAPLAIGLAGVALVVFAAGSVRVVGWGVLAVAGVVAVALVFLEVGYSEDRARDRGEAPATARRSDGYRTPRGRAAHPGRSRTHQSH